MGRHSDYDGDDLADHATDEAPIGEYEICDDRPRDGDGNLLADAPARRTTGGV